jgi:PKD repeat protein
MKSKSPWVARGALAASTIAAALFWAGSASALTNGDPCSPFWTEVASPAVDIESSPPAVSKGEAVHVDGSLSIPGTADMWTFVSSDNLCEATRTVHDPIAFYTWTFGDGSPPETHAAPNSTATHSYSKPGTYTITLSVTEQNCEGGATAHCFTGQTTAPIIVRDNPPVASFNAPASVTIGQPANFDASMSADPDGFITGYDWDFGDGHSQDTAGPTTSHTYRRGGSDTVTLTVTDDDGSVGIIDQTVSVIDQPPIASFTVPAGVAKGLAAKFDASGSADPDDAITRYRWDFGDGTTQSTTAPVTTHTYSQAGREAVTLTVIDEGGNSDSVQHTVTVAGRLATASFTGPAAVGVGHPAAFNASGSSDPNGTITSYRWDFGDGQTSTTSAPTASHAYAVAGPVTVTLTITDNSGGIAVAQRSLNVVASACVVPRLFGRKLGVARRILSASGCRLGAVRHRRTRAGRRRRVIKQSITPGAIRPAGQAVTVTIGK